MGSASDSGEIKGESDEPLPMKTKHDECTEAVTDLSCMHEPPFLPAFENRICMEALV